MSLFSTLTTKAQALAALNALLAVNDVADNATKLALTGIDPLYMVRVTGEANRIEQYIGTDPSSDANWIVLRNTIQLSVLPYASANDLAGNPLTAVDGGISGTPCPVSELTDLGWVDPATVGVTNGASYFLRTAFGIVADDNQSSFQFPFLPPRGAIRLTGIFQPA